MAAAQVHEVRLELLKLTYTHGRDVKEAVERAREMERYLDEPKQAPARPRAPEVVRR